MKDQIRSIAEEALKEISACQAGRETIEALRIKYLGRKGIITELFKKMSSVSSEDRPEVGGLINALKEKVTLSLDEKLAPLLGEEAVKERIDVTLPGIPANIGRIHPITKTINEVSALFISLGFRVVEGPEIETCLLYTSDAADE